MMYAIEPDIRTIIKELEDTFQAVDTNEAATLVAHIVRAEQVFVVGVGRVLLALQAMVKRLNHLGIKTYYVGQIDEPAATEHDFLIVASNSGESLIPACIAKKAKDLGVPVAYVGSNPQSTVGLLADLTLKIPVSNKLGGNGAVNSVQPMTSLFEQIVFLLGDAIAMAILRENPAKGRKGWDVHANLE